MKSKFLLTLGLLSLTMSLSAQTNQQVLELINKEVQQNSEAYQQLKKATETIGHRATGTENGRLAEEYAANLLRSYGYNVSFQEFLFNGWNRKSLNLKINNQPIKAVALAHSPANVSLSGELIDLGNGLEEDYKKNADLVKGKIVLATIGLLDGTAKDVENLHRSEKTALAEKYGAKGIILFNRAPGGILLTGTASVTGEIIKIPSINISLEDGLKIKDNLKKGKEIAKIEMKNDVGQMKGRNIIAKKIGAKFPNEKIVLGGHLDSWDLATGAIDNGVGSFSVIDIARTYEKLKLPNDRTIEFVLFMGEEVGLLGSKYYVNEAIKDGSISEIKAMSNMDMTTNPKSYYSTMESNLPVLTAYAKDVQQVIPDFKLATFASVDLHSDHQPFMLQGVPIIGLSDSQFKEGALNCYHANCDTFDYVEEVGLKNNVILETYLLYRLSNLKEIPSKRWSEQETKEALIKGNLETPLRISGDWRW
ncbi:M28 family peptidase [Empedobacter brevis]|uniref:M28 family peptidase n=1 Tax=Empedobacter brevis TaxID=247 RepID=UPI0039AF6259